MGNHDFLKTNAEQIATTEAVVWENSPYYDDAERWTWLFWSEEKSFLPLFKQLDLSNLLELACGHGRHGEYVLSHFGEQIKSFVMMDILQSNVDYCRARIGGHNNLQIVTNSGVGYQPIPNCSVTAIFCYDAMVHFHRDVVRSYLVDTHRILKPGGKGLFHHSNYAFDPDASFGTNPHARAFMSNRLFKKYTESSGLEVVEQKVIAWGDNPDLDCLSLIRKPG